MILNAFFKALGQIGDPRFRGVLFLGVGLTLLVLIAVTSGFVWLATWLVGDSLTLPWIGEIAWAQDVAGWSSFVLMLGLSVFLMVPVASAAISMFLDRVADAVEARHYPGLPPAIEIPFWDNLRDALAFFGVMIAANIAALILYFMFAPFAPFIFWAMNGFLLGREYFTLAAMRRVGRDGAIALRKRHIGTIWLAGALMAVPLSVPLLNLVIPILGAATFTHIFHALEARQN